MTAPGIVRSAAPQREDGLRVALRAFATGVTVVTVGGAEPHGMTANSLTSVSLEPPLVLLCVARSATMHLRLRRVPAFGVSVLAGDQEPVARHFSDGSRPLGRAGFDRVAWFAGEHTAAPLITGAAAWLECRIWRSYPGGDHDIVVAEVLAAWAGQAPAGGLLFWQRRFRSVAPAGPDRPGG